MPYKEGHNLLHYVSEELGWDDLTLYNIPRTFATRAKGNIPDEQLKLLLGHRNTNLHVADNVYVSDHVPIDPAAFVAGGKRMHKLHSEASRAAAGCSYGVSASEAPEPALNNPHIAAAVEKAGQLQAEAMRDKFVACRVKHLAIDLCENQDWTAHLSEAQVKLVERLQEAKIDFLSVYSWATGGSKPALDQSA